MNNNLPAFITPKSLKRTILYDGYTNLWFDILFSRVEKKYIPKDRSLLVWLEAIAWIFVILCFLSAILLKKILFAVAGGFLIGLAFFSIWQRRNDLADQAACFLTEQQQDVTQMTLYQWTEILAKQHNIPSLVDIMSGDRILWVAQLVFFFGAILIGFWSNLAACFFLGVGMLFTRFIIRVRIAWQVNRKAR